MNPKKDRDNSKKNINIRRVDEKPDETLDSQQSELLEEPASESDAMTSTHEDVQETTGDKQKVELSDEEKVAKLENEIATLQDELLRERAAIINYRKRSEEEKAQIRRYGAQDFAFDLLTVLDYLEESLKFDSATTDTDAIVQGVKFTVEEFYRLIGKHGIKAIKTDVPFDPKLHEAFATEEKSDKDPGTILKVHRKGYIYKDRVLRAAMVTVAKEPEKSSERSTATNGNSSDGDEK